MRQTQWWDPWTYTETSEVTSSTPVDTVEVTLDPDPADGATSLITHLSTSLSTQEASSVGPSVDPSGNSTIADGNSNSEATGNSVDSSEGSDSAAATVTDSESESPSPKGSNEKEEDGGGGGVLTLFSTAVETEADGNQTGHGASRVAQASTSRLQAWIAVLLLVFALR